MSIDANSTAARLVPTLRYRDIAAAVEWLCSAFGFKRLRVVTGIDGSIQQAHIAFGSDIIMLLPARDFGADAAAQDLAVAELQSCYFVVDDADQHHRNAKAAGAEILDIRQYDLGGRGYSCRDPEGHVWSFGTYNPRQQRPPEPRQQQPEPRRPPQYDPWTVTRSPVSPNPLHVVADAPVGRLRPRLTLTSVTTALATVVVSAATIGWLLGALPQPAASARDTRDSKLVNRLAEDGPGKVVDNPAPLPTETSTERTQGPERTQARPLLFGSPVQQRATEDETPATARAPRLISEPAPEPTANQGQQAAERDPDGAAKEAAERAAQDALKQWREAQEKLRQLSRERSVKEAAEQAELEARQRAAAKAVRAPVNTEPPKRAAAAKEAPKPAVKEAPAKASAPERSGAQTAKADALKKEPAARAAEPVVRVPRMENAEQARAEPPKRAEPAASASADQIWDCVPRPPEGKVICHPIPNRP
ncbi:MAG: VOC family protein [Hyphomicrobiaceae bacterium]